MFGLEVQLQNLPDVPGIYLFYNLKKELIYVGKATSLRSRVRSYWRGARTSRPIEQMIHEVVNIKTIVTDSVLEAIILEGKYIKEKQPKYNVDWKDDKSWNYLALTKDEYPKLVAVREHDLNFDSPTKISLSNRQTGLGCHSCKSRNPVVVGLDSRFHGDDSESQSDKKGYDNKGEEIDKKQYSNLTIKQFTQVFGPFPGLKTAEVLKILRHIFKYSTCTPCQQVVSNKNVILSAANDLNHQDNKKQCRPCFYYQIKECLGVCVGEITPQEYKQKVVRPLILFLSGKKQTLLRQLNNKMKIVSRARNFEEAARLRDQIFALQKIQDIALLNKDFFRFDTGAQNYSSSIKIEGYDISNLGKTDKVGSLVVFKDGAPIKNEYRKFNIKTVAGQSDVDCLSEVLNRRLNHSEWPLPDYFLIDGGVPQVSAVQKILRARGVDRPVIGIAKGPKRQRNDFIFDHSKQNVVEFIRAHQLTFIAARDEAHRFAITFNRSKRIIK